MAVRPPDYLKVSLAIFTEPEIASIGLEEVDVAAQGRRFGSPRFRLPRTRGR